MRSSVRPSGGRFSRNAAIPSAASCVRIRSSKYSRSSSGRTVADVRRRDQPRGGGRVPQRRRRSSARGALRTSASTSAASSPSAPTSSISPARSHSAAPTDLPGEDRARRARRADPRRQQRGRRRRKHAERDLRQPNVAPRSAKMKSHASASSKPPPRQRPRTSAAVGAGSIEQVVDQRVHLRQHALRSRSGACSGMLAPKLKSAPAPFDRDQLQVRVRRRALSSAGSQRADHLGGDDVALRDERGERGARLIGVERTAAPARSRPRSGLTPARARSASVESPAAGR